MVVDLMLFAAFGLGGGALCVAAGVAMGTCRRGVNKTFPVTHVSFDPDLPDEDRLVFLDRAADAVRSGRLRQAQQLEDERAGDEGK